MRRWTSFGRAGCWRPFPASSTACRRARGGVSRPPYTSLNMGFHTGDRPEDVVENRRRWLEVLGLRLDEAVFAEQVHGAEVALVAAETAARAPCGLRTRCPARTRW